MVLIGEDISERLDVEPKRHAPSSRWIVAFSSGRH
jgi:hypothetical protein